MARRQNSARQSALKEEVKEILAEDRDLLKTIVAATLQQTLEAEMDEALAAEKSERTAARLGYRSGYYGRGLVTRIGKIARGINSKPFFPAAADTSRRRWHPAPRSPFCLISAKVSEASNIRRNRSLGASASTRRVARSAGRAHSPPQGTLA